MRRAERKKRELSFRLYTLRVTRSDAVRYRRTVQSVWQQCTGVLGCKVIKPLHLHYHLDCQDKDNSCPDSALARSIVSNEAFLDYVVGYTRDL